jgi:hypothetical protein
VVKVPTTSGNVEKSYMAVMVTGVRVEADADGTESIVKKAIVHSAIAAEIILLCCIVSILLVVFFIVRAASSFQLNLEIALGGVPAKVQPHGLLQPGRRYVETSGDVIEDSFSSTSNSCLLYFSSVRLGAAKTARARSTHCESPELLFVRPLESTAETQPQLQPALLRLSAVLLIVAHSRRRFVHFNLGGHFLDLSGLLF